MTLILQPFEVVLGGWGVGRNFEKGNKNQFPNSRSKKTSAAETKKIGFFAQILLKNGIQPKGGMKKEKVYGLFIRRSPKLRIFGCACNFGKSRWTRWSRRGTSRRTPRDIPWWYSRRPHLLRSTRIRSWIPLRVTGRTVTTIPIYTTVCAKDGFQLVANTWKADKIQIPTFGIRFRCQTDIGKMSPAISPTFSPAKSFPFQIPSRSDLWPRCYGSPSRASIQYRGRMGYPDWTASTAQARCFRDSISASYSH